MEIANGVKFETNPDGVVLWSDDWSALFGMAYDQRYGLSIRRGGPGTLGHCDVVASPVESVGLMIGNMRISHAETTL